MWSDVLPVRNNPPTQRLLLELQRLLAEGCLTPIHSRRTADTVARRPDITRFYVPQGDFSFS